MDRTAAPAAPDTIESLFRLVAGRAEAMPRRLRQCAEFIVRNPDRVAVSTVAELAAAAEVQPSALMRFCQELGFSGFSQMQRLFRDDYSRKWPDYSTRLQSLRATGERRPEVLLAEFVEAGRASLERLMGTVDPGALERAVAMLSAAATLHLVGYRRSFPVASYLAYAFEAMAIPTFCTPESASCQPPMRCGPATRCWRSPSHPTAPRPSPSSRRPAPGTIRWSRSPTACRTRSSG